MRKHNPQSHGNRVCHVCTRIMEDNFDNDMLDETSSPSSTTSGRSSISSSSSSVSRYAQSELNSYQADHSSPPSSASDFKFSDEDIPDEPVKPQYPVKLADIEYMAETMEYRHVITLNNTNKLSRLFIKF